MKKSFKILFSSFIALLLLLSLGKNSYSQCTANNYTYRYSTSTIYTPTGTWSSVNWANGNWQPFYLYEAYIAQVRTCDASWDTQLTLYGTNTSSSSYRLAYNDDCSIGNCAYRNSIIAYRCEGDGGVTGHLQLNKYRQFLYIG